MRAVSIMYHDVLGEGEPFDASGFPGADADLYKVTREDFEAHLCALAGALADGVTDVLHIEDLQRGAEPVLLTFDDGGRGALLAADLLEERGWRGHFLVATDFIGHSTFLKRGEIRWLHERGHVIGSHSASHPLRMASLPMLKVREEWKRSVGELSSIIGERVRVASIPGGQYSRRVAEEAAGAGIEYLFTSEPVTRTWSVNGCMVLGRYTVQRRTAAQTVARIAQGEQLPRLSQYALWNLKKGLKRFGGDAYLRIRQKILGRRARSVRSG